MHGWDGVKNKKTGSTTGRKNNWFYMKITAGMVVYVINN